MDKQEKKPYRKIILIRNSNKTIIIRLKREIHLISRILKKQKYRNKIKEKRTNCLKLTLKKYRGMINLIEN